MNLNKLNYEQMDKIRIDIALDFCKTFQQWQIDNPCQKCKQPRLDIYTKEKGLICCNCHHIIKLSPTVKETKQ